MIFAVCCGVGIALASAARGDDVLTPRTAASAARKASEYDDRGRLLMLLLRKRNAKYVLILFQRVRKFYAVLLGIMRCR